MQFYDEISSNPKNMDKILAPIKQRILQLPDYIGVSKKIFFEKVGVSASNFRSKSLFSEIGADVIAKISSTFYEVNIVWLITGKGKAIIKNNNANEVSETDNNRETEYLREMLEDKNKLITSLQKQIELLEEKLPVNPKQYKSSSR